MFSAFIGIDWSGAKGPRQPGIQLAMARPGKGVPDTWLAEDSRHWGRDDVRDRLLAEASNANGAPVLVGIDFAFAHPFHDEGAYYPGLGATPADAPSLWQMVETVCADDQHLYGGAMFAADGVGDYYLSPKNHVASHYRSRRRLTELASRASARAPSPTFKAIGADNVTTGSMAGMRLIYALKVALGSRLAVWPFDHVTPGSPGGLAMVLVEIFPSYYFHVTGMNPAKNAAADPAFMNAALTAYGSECVGPDYAPRGADADEADAIISAAALRYFAGRPEYWRAPREAAREGWIFGVPPET